MDADKRALLEATLARIEKAHGKGAAMFGAERSHEKIAVIPTGSLTLDAALGVGGWPRGRIVEIYGPEASGKTTLALHAIAECQKMGGIAAFIDAEHAIDPDYARNLGVNFDDMLISQPESGEQALQIVEDIVRSGAVDLVVIDSVAALVPRAEIEGDMADMQVGLQARLMSKALRKITGALSSTNTTAIFINQLREKIGGMSYGSNEVTTGGKALKFYATVRIDIRRIGAIKQGDDIIGNDTKIKVAKNKVSPPFKVVNVDIIYGEGIAHEAELLNLGSKFNVVVKKGAWYYYSDVTLGQGAANARQFLKDNPEMAAEIEFKIRESLGMIEVDEVEFDDDPVSEEELSA
jgi:recombination protein RecA